MFDFLKWRLGRRDLFRSGAFAAVPGLFGYRASAAGPLRIGKDLYESIGVRPLINARGTFTIVSGSLMLPEVRAAMTEAAQHYVHMDELMDAVGARIAELTKTEAAMVSCGCSAALTHATAACIAGGNPDLHVRIPDLTGFAKNEVIIPGYSRNVYDAAIRAVGAKVIEPNTAAELEDAFGPRTAMVYILASPRAENGPLSTKAISQIAKARNVPVLVDAAAEILTVPNVHIDSGATLVAYSGGKCIRGPQTAGLLLGRKDLVKAAWVHSSPHHGFARSMKIGKEEAMGMLMAVEMWMKRDHKAEWSRWQSWLDHIAKRVSTIDGVTTAVREPAGLSNRAPQLSIRWDAAKLGITGGALAAHLFNSEPRIVLPSGGGGRGGPAAGGETGISIMPYMMMPGDEKIIGDRLHAVLKNPPKQETTRNAPPAVDLTGRWDVRVDYLASSSNHVLHLKQQGARIEGTHQGDFESRDLGGSVSGDEVRLMSSYNGNGDSIPYQFSGKAVGDEISGTLEMGEYLGARWTAKRHEYRNRRQG